MSTRTKFIDLRDSTFFRLPSPHKLASILLIELEDLEKIAQRGSANYRQFRNDDRWIETPLPALKRLQRRIHDLLSQITPPDYLFSGYKGRSSVLNARQHSGNADMVKLDLRRFYPSSDGNRVHRLFENTFQTPPDVAALISKLCTIRNTVNSSRSHLPTGGVTSPILAYFTYKDLFDGLDALAKAHGAKMTAMADDITFSEGASDHHLLKAAKRLIGEFGLRSNDRKQKLWSARHNNKIVTGALVTPKGIRVPKKLKDKIQKLKSDLAQCASPSERAKLYQKLCGSLSSAGQVEERFLPGARCTLDAWRKDTEAWQEHLRLSRKRVKAANLHLN